MNILLIKLEILTDGGIRKGTDVVKALCLGAKGIEIGRAALWGLGAGGIADVERKLESNFTKKPSTVIRRSLLTVLDEELKTAMRLIGAR